MNRGYFEQQNYEVEMSERDTFRRRLFGGKPVQQTTMFPQFDGQTIAPALDNERLQSAMGKVFTLMRDGKWRTLHEIAMSVCCSESGASARLRDFRKPKFQEVYGNCRVNSRRVENGLWEYQIVKE